MGIKFGRNIDKNANIMIDEYAFENVVCKMMAILGSGLYWATHMKLTRVPGPAAAWNLHDLMPTALRELRKNNEVYCDTH